VACARRAAPARSWRSQRRGPGLAGGQAPRCDRRCHRSRDSRSAGPPARSTDAAKVPQLACGAAVAAPSVPRRLAGALLVRRRWRTTQPQLTPGADRCRWQLGGGGWWRRGPLCRHLRRGSRLDASGARSMLDVFGSPGTRPRATPTCVSHTLNNADTEHFLSCSPGIMSAVRSGGIESDGLCLLS
jgi:hypothetical protein